MVPGRRMGYGIGANRFTMRERAVLLPPGDTHSRAAATRQARPVPTLWRCSPHGRSWVSGLRSHRCGAGAPKKGEVLCRSPRKSKAVPQAAAESVNDRRASRSSASAYGRSCSRRPSQSITHRLRAIKQMTAATLSTTAPSSRSWRRSVRLRMTASRLANPVTTRGTEGPAGKARVRKMNESPLSPRSAARPAAGPAAGSSLPRVNVESGPRSRSY